MVNIKTWPRGGSPCSSGSCFSGQIKKGMGFNIKTWPRGGSPCSSGSCFSGQIKKGMGVNIKTWPRGGSPCSSGSCFSGRTCPLYGFNNSSTSSALIPTPASVMVREVSHICTYVLLPSDLGYDLGYAINGLKKRPPCTCTRGLPPGDRPGTGTVAEGG